MITKGTLDIFSALPNHSADSEAKYGTDKTPLLLAVAEAPFGDLEHVLNGSVGDGMLARGADVGVVVDNGKSAYQSPDQRH